MSNTMRKNAGRAGAMVAALAIGLAVSPAVASAEDSPKGDPGLQNDELVEAFLADQYNGGAIPVAFLAEGNDNCEVTFTVRNRTQSANYLVDYLIDGEDPKLLKGEAPTGNTYDFGTLGGNGPHGDTPIGVRTVGRPGVQSLPSETEVENDWAALNWLGTAKENTNTIKLRDLTDLPNPKADEHTITYQQIEGPVRGDFGIQSKLPTFSTTVTGCADAPGSMDFGSLFGSLGSNDATAPKLGSS